MKVICPEFSDAIDKIIDFWNQFGPSDVRKKYNYCKHKGKPGYSELLALDNTRLMGIYFQDKDSGKKVEMASDTKDVKYGFSLEEAIEELRKFDDEMLFPYIIICYEVNFLKVILRFALTGFEFSMLGLYHVRK